MAEKNDNINKLGKDLDKVIKDMKKTGEQFTKANAEKRPELLTKLKDLTREKNAVKGQLATAISDAEKDPMLNISENKMPKLTELVPIIESAEDADADIEKALKAGMADFKAAFNSLEDAAKEDVAKVDENAIRENLRMREEKGQINESGVLLAVSIIAAAPKALEIFAKAMSKVVKVFKTKVMGQPDVEDPEWIKGILDIAHKWHKGYIKMIKWCLWATGSFRSIGVEKDSPEADKIAEQLYYAIVLGLLLASGAGGIKAAMEGHKAAAMAEGALTAIKSAEMVEFLAGVGITGLAKGKV